MSARSLVFAAAGSSSVPLPPDGTLWMTQLNSPVITGNYSNNLGIAVDSAGTSYTVGQVSEGGVADFSVIRHSATGMLLWQHRAVAWSSINIRGQSIAVDSGGNSYAVGYYDNGSNNDILILKLSISGAKSWFRKLTGSNYDAAYGVALDSLANVYTTGYTYNSAGTIASAFLTKHNSSGVIQWQRTLTPASGVAQGNAVVTDASANVYVCGAATSSGLDKGFIAKYNSSGVLQWQRQVTSTGTTPFWGMAIDSSANLYVGGYQGNTSSGILLKYDSSGALQWQRTIGSTIRSVAVDNLGYVYTVSNGGDIAKYSTAGVLQWTMNLKFTATNLSMQGVKYYNSALFIAAVGTLSGSNAITVRVPSDGTGQGTYNYFTYAASSVTDAAGTATEGAGVLTDAAGTMTDASFTSVDNYYGRYLNVIS